MASEFSVRITDVLVLKPMYVLLLYVRWAGVLSHGFHVSNGVRQGEILSPSYLMYIWMIFKYCTEWLSYAT